jgi:hypothetical protein
MWLTQLRLWWWVRLCRVKEKVQLIVTCKKYGVLSKICVIVVGLTNYCAPAGEAYQKALEVNREKIQKVRIILNFTIWAHNVLSRFLRQNHSTRLQFYYNGDDDIHPGRKGAAGWFEGGHWSSTSSFAWSWFSFRVPSGYKNGEEGYRSRDGALAAEGDCYEQLLGRLEGLSAFAEKRKPVCVHGKVGVWSGDGLALLLLY